GLIVLAPFSRSPKPRTNMHILSAPPPPIAQAIGDKREKLGAEVLLAEPPAPPKSRARSRKRRRPGGIGEAASQSLGECWARYRRQLRRCQRKLTIETLHDLRVQTRRTLVCIEAFFSVIGEQKEFTAALRTLTKRLSALGPLRDAHVQLIELDDRLAEFPE